MIILGALLITYMLRGDNEIQKSIGYFFVILCISSIFIFHYSNRLKNSFFFY